MDKHLPPLLLRLAGLLHLVQLKFNRYLGSIMISAVDGLDVRSDRSVSEE